MPPEISAPPSDTSTVVEEQKEEKPMPEEKSGLVEIQPALSAGGGGGVGTSGGGPACLIDFPPDKEYLWVEPQSPRPWEVVYTDTPTIIVYVHNPENRPIHLAVMSLDVQPVQAIWDSTCNFLIYTPSPLQDGMHTVSVFVVTEDEDFTENSYVFETRVNLPELTHFYADFVELGPDGPVMDTTKFTIFSRGLAWVREEWINPANWKIIDENTGQMYQPISAEAPVGLPSSVFARLYFSSPLPGELSALTIEFYSPLLGKFARKLGRALSSPPPGDDSRDCTGSYQKVGESIIEDTEGHWATMSFYRPQDDHGTYYLVSSLSMSGPQPEVDNDFTKDESAFGYVPLVSTIGAGHPESHTKEFPPTPSSFGDTCYCYPRIRPGPIPCGGAVASTEGDQTKHKLLKMEVVSAYERATYNDAKMQEDVASSLPAEWQGLPEFQNLQLAGVDAFKISYFGDPVAQAAADRNLFLKIITMEQDGANRLGLGIVMEKAIRQFFRDVGAPYGAACGARGAGPSYYIDKPPYAAVELPDRDGFPSNEGHVYFVMLDPDIFDCVYNDDWNNAPFYVQSYSFFFTLITMPFTGLSKAQTRIMFKWNGHPLLPFPPMEGNMSTSENIFWKTPPGMTHLLSRVRMPAILMTRGIVIRSTVPRFAIG